MNTKVHEAYDEFEEGYDRGLWKTPQEYYSSDAPRLAALDGPEFKELRSLIQESQSCGDSKEGEWSGYKPEKGTRLGQYVLVEFLGKGTYGEVWLAKHETFKRPRAIKFLLRGSEEKRKASLDHEVNIQDQIRNVVGPYALWRDHICEVYEVFQEPTAFVMEHLDGGDLKDWIKALGVNEAALVCRGVARGLFLTHKCGHGHFDVKPSNILFKDDHDFARVKLCDFGIAKGLGADLQMTIGSDPYMPPESHAKSGDSTKRVDEFSDVFSLGVVLYEMLTGELPFGLTGMSNTDDAPTPPHVMETGVSRELSELCLQMIERTPKNRPRLLDDRSGAKREPSVIGVLDDYLSGTGGWNRRGEPDNEGGHERGVNEMERERALDLAMEAKALFYGHGVELNPKAGLARLKDAADLDPYWSGQLGLYYFTGSASRSIERDQGLGKRLLNRAAEIFPYWNGVVGGLMLDNDSFGDSKQGLQRMVQAGKEDKEIARALAFRYREGVGVERDEGKFREWKEIVESFA